MRPRIIAFIRKLVGEGRQVFIVCPAVEENTEEATDSLKNVKDYEKELRETTFPELRVGLVHGKQKPKEKNEVMARFAAGELDILVATTVIEVGVDVPNAALMVVENADRFGLSQLHQLRGRVGRGQHKSYCVLFAGSDGEKARERLGAMTRTNDGFQIAEEDLRLRGPGDFFGSRQSGLPEMQLASFSTDMELLQRAQEA
ncbi:MAG: helicase-related protein, partial [bacterium]